MTEFNPRSKAIPGQQVRKRPSDISRADIRAATIAFFERGGEVQVLKPEVPMYPGFDATRVFEGKRAGMSHCIAWEELA